MRMCDPPPARRGVLLVGSILILIAVLATSCKPAPKPKAVLADSGVVTESFSVQDESTSHGATGSVSATTAASLVSGIVSKTTTYKPKYNHNTAATAAPANPTSRPDATPDPGTFWPVKLNTFTKEWKKPTWYPTYVPKGYVLDSLDIVQFGGGPVCSTWFTDGQKAITFTQGSPTNRTFPIVSLGKVTWGSAKADLMHQDPADVNSGFMIVYSSGGNLAVVSGDAPTDELKKVAASMKAVPY